MKTTQKYLDELMRAYPAVRNDSQLSELIGITRAAVSQYRSGHSMSVPVAIKVARLLGICPLLTVATTMYEQSRDDAEKTLWRKLYKEAQTKEFDL